MSDGELWNELRRVRDKVHDLVTLEATVAAQGRLIGATRRELRELVERVDDMTEAEKIQHAVTTAITAERANRWTRPRKLAGAIAAVILLVPAVHDLAAWLPG